MICKDQPTELYCSVVKHKSPANPLRAAPQQGHVPSREKLHIKQFSLKSGHPQDVWTPIWLKACVYSLSGNLVAFEVFY